ncbi:RidA family protein [Xiamenia xianingshaonis]|uniref:Reactive intermediate/imine deaminase n=1 Tax=Xiamenia xianingshaonis TaxID=2682776 RepID=A0A9E6MPM7_9ACTN|nr:RidA family protein [Xiamenia xianingshaonis]NHM14272.1 reactive intermediate/imine deaminase [Xiamenia xianingshaonis]QTU84119.1 reactive intermediate/imine deaminase [Xiamenia xianingshaonis]
MSDDNVVIGRNVEGAPINPLASQTVAFSHYNNLSMQLGIDPETGSLVEGGVRDQADQALANLEAVIEGIGHELTDTVRLSVFVKDIRDIDAIDEVVEAYFPTYVPARTTVAVNDLPQGALVAMDALISNAEGTIPNAPQTANLVKLTNNTAGAPVQKLSTQTVAFSHYNNLTAQLGIDPVTNRPVEGGVAAQAAQALRNIKAILTSIDVPFDDIVKTTVFLTDLADVEAVNEVYKTFFPDSGIARAVNYLPARTVIEVADLPLSCSVMIEAVVSHGDGTPPQEVEARHGLIVEACNTDDAPKCSMSTQSVAFSHYNHLSMQFGRDASGKLVAGGVKEQAAQALANVKAVIESVGHTLEDAVKVNVYLTDLGDLDAFNEAYQKFFPQGVPARRVVGVKALPLEGAVVMVDAIFGNAEGTPPTVA